MNFRRFSVSFASIAILISQAALFAHAQTLTQNVYADALSTRWVNYSWATVNLSSTSPVHTGTKAISVTPGAGQALYLHRNAFDSTPYANLTFWINGGTTGGQVLHVQATLSGAAQTSVVIPTLIANTWQQVTIPLSSLGVANKTNLDGFWIQAGAAQANFSVDDITINPAAPPSTVNVSVNAASVLRTLDNRTYGVNTQFWDPLLGTANTQTLLSTLQTKFMRFGGGSTSDQYDWSTNRNINTDGTEQTWQWTSSFATYMTKVLALGAQTILTANYGNGTPQMAAAWVAYANGSTTNTTSIGVDVRGHDWKTVGYWASMRAAAPLATNDGYNFLRVSHAAPYGIVYWEIGNECYGGWEVDVHGTSGSGLTGVAHDPYTYAQNAAVYIQKMKAVDSTIKIGVVGATGEDSYGNGTHPVANPNEGGSTHTGWTAVVLATLKSLGVTPNFLIYHRYPQNASTEDDYNLLLIARGWPSDATNLRKMLTDYCGTTGVNTELIATETNGAGEAGKQSVSLVNGLYYADSYACVAPTEFNGCIWWAFRDGTQTNGNMDPLLYGWRAYGDFGLVASNNTAVVPNDTLLPAFYGAKLMTHWGRGGDKVVTTTSSYLLLSAYASKLANGDLAILVINKHPSSSLTANIALSGFAPTSANATMYQYGKTQDTNSTDLAQSTLTNASSSFSVTFPPYSMSVIIVKGTP